MAWAGVVPILGYLVGGELIRKRRAAGGAHDRIRQGIEHDVGFVARVNGLVTSRACLQKERARVVVAALGRPPERAIKEGVRLVERTALVRCKQKEVRPEFLRIDVAGPESEALNPGSRRGHQQRLEGVPAPVVALERRIAEVPVANHLLSHGGLVPIAAPDRFTAHVDLQKPVIAALAQGDGDERVGVKWKVELASVVEGNFQAGGEAGGLVEVLVGAPVEGPPTLLGRNPKGQQHLGERGLVLDRVESNAAVFLPPVLGWPGRRASPEVGVQRPVPVDADGIRANVFAMARAGNVLVVKQPRETVPKRTLALIGAPGNQKQLPRGDDAVFVEEFKNEVVVVAELDGAGRLRRVAIALILLPRPALRECLLSGAVA